MMKYDRCGVGVCRRAESNSYATECGGDLSQSTWSRVIDCLVTSSRETGSAFLRAAIALALSVCCVTAARAGDAVDTAVDAFAIAGSSVGVTLNDTEKDIVKTVVRCVGKSLDGKKLGLDVCARGEVVKRMPPEAQPLVACMLGGKTVDACTAEAMLDRLPVEARGVTKAMASCLATRPDFGRCVTQVPSGAKYRLALELVDKLKADNRTNLGDGQTATIRNIIQVANGIRDDDWISVSYYGGVEVYKVAAKIVLNIILTPAFQPLIGPIADDIIQHRADLFARVVKAVKHTDHRAATEAVVEFYLVMHIEVACALPMPDDMRETMCGTAGKIIKGVAKAGSDVAELAERLIERPLNIPWTLWDATQRGRELASGKSNSCDSPAVYYAETYARCYHRGAKLMMTNPRGLDAMTATINHECREYYDRCYFSNRFDGLCNPQRKMFNMHVGQVARGLDEAAAKYARTFAGSITNSITYAGKEACQGLSSRSSFVAKEIEDFKKECARDLRIQVPAPGNPLDDSCGGKFTFRDTAHWLACERALDAVHPLETAAGVCRATWPKVVRHLGKKPPPRRLSEIQQDFEVGIKLPTQREPLIRRNEDVTRHRDMRVVPPQRDPSIRRNEDVTRHRDIPVVPPQRDPTR
ncbi:hypothetical protein [Cupriavidus oxalaticus]|uniref:Uncharacterized protein n=1 Tax=Cupriavidus oxalaticus TaxID=96344 RepID=A0A4V1BZJ1_9BURK|nr:hypothetical protein [Cupriavidus oxalaticus]QBY55502.1 hypothetical protein E0W60_31245 [Cupriavidus oxalaticus]